MQRYATMLLNENTMVTKSNSKSMSNSNVRVTFKCFLSETSMYGIYQFTRRIIAIIQRSPAINPVFALRVLSEYPEKIAKSKGFFYGIVQYI